MRDASEVTERTSSASLCKRWSRSASRAAIRRCSACSSDSASAFRFLRPGSWMAQRFREVGRRSFATAHARHLYRTASLAPLLAIPGSDASSRMTRRPLPYAVVLVPADPPTADRRRAATDSEVSMCQHGLRVARELSALAANACYRTGHSQNPRRNRLMSDCGAVGCGCCRWAASASSATATRTPAPRRTFRTLGTKTHLHGLYHHALGSYATCQIAPDAPLGPLVKRSIQRYDGQTRHSVAAEARGVARSDWLVRARECR